jgi:protein transport protein SEC24
LNHLPTAFDMADKKKKSRYAAGYDFGANAALAGAQTGGAPAPQYGAQPQYGQPPPPAQGYAPGIPVAPQADPNTLGQSFQNLNLGPQAQQYGQPQPTTIQQPAVSQAPTNQLLPSDLIAQPVLAYELEQPPPPINLPSNAAATPSPRQQHLHCCSDLR